MTNKEFSTQNTEFQAKCAAVGIPPTPRQASKYRAKRGLAYTGKKPSAGR